MRKRNQTTKSRYLALPALLLGVASAACSEGAARLSPVGPSAVVEPPAPTSSATTAAWASRNGWSTLADGRAAVADGVFVEGADVVEDVTGGCPARTIFLRGVPVTVTTSTTFSAPLTCDSLASGHVVKVTGLLMHKASGFSVSATHLAVVGGDRAPSPPAEQGERLSAEGVVGAVSGACPSLTFVFMGHRLQTTRATAYRGGSCESVREGVQVVLDVLKQRDGSVTVESIAFANGGRRD
jgi:hypothetical protein